jgi:hypothetical protein
MSSIVIKITAYIANLVDMQNTIPTIIMMVFEYLILENLYLFSQKDLINA